MGNLQATDRVAANLVEMMRDASVPPSVRLAAARELLDRTGLVGKQELDLAVHVSKWDDLLNDLVLVVDKEEEDDNFDANVR